MPDVTITVSGSTAIKAFVDGTQVAFAGGAATVSGSTGENSLQWVIVDTPGTSYTISIKAPSTAAWSYTATLDASQKDAGLHWFTL